MKSLKKLLAFVLAFVLVLGLVPATVSAAGADEIVYNGTESITYKGITFQRQQGGTYDGIPLFDAEPEHLDAYLDVYMDYIGLDGMVRIGLEGERGSGRGLGKKRYGKEGGVSGWRMVAWRWWLGDGGLEMMAL